MLIKDIFAKNLFRSINGVVKADQRDDAIVWQELDEYVITKELDQHFRKFFDTFVYAVSNSSDPNVTGRTGIWISGFFGSGKSHFLKILSYLLQNIQARNPETGETRRAISFFENKIQDSMLLADIKRAAGMSTDAILFNIDSKADPGDGKGAVLNVFWRVFNEMQGFSGDAFHIAEMERYLTEKGKYQEFCSVFKELTGEEWLKERDAYSFYRDQVVTALSRVLGLSPKSAEDWFDNAQQNMNITVENFAKKVRDYLQQKGNDHRIIFLVDEVGQFIGSDGNLMLNLQTIVEDLGIHCLGRAWVVVTSQEDIDYILGELKTARANDFSKIQDRFYPPLSLSGSNTDEVIQIRILEKTPEAEQELRDTFADKGDILMSQLSFTEDSASLQSYKTRKDFVRNYPFASFHFQLVQKIFESIRKVGASGLHLGHGARSMLDAFLSAAKNLSTQNIGALAPLYAFYPTIESFLDTTIKRTIDQAHDNPGLANPFDVHLLQTLFLIRYVDIIKSNVDNLVTLFISEVDADRLAIKRDIEAGLQRLEKQTLISRNGDLYFFLTNEERDVSREIKGVDISGSEEVRLMAEVIYDDILKGQKQHRYTPYMRDYGFNRLLDRHPYGAKLDQEISLEVITPLVDDYTSFNEIRNISLTSENPGRVIIRLPSTPELEREVRTYLQTDKYVRQKMDASLTPSFKRILRDRQEENRERKNRIITLTQRLLLEADYYTLGQTLSVTSSTPRAAVEEAIEYVIQNLYNKFSYIDKLHDDPLKEIKSALLTSDIGRENIKDELAWVNKEAMKEVWEYINLMIGKNHQVLLHELVAHFGKRPYGWPEWEAVLLVVNLFVAEKLNLLTEGSNLTPREALDHLLKTPRWKSIKILKRKNPSEEDIKTAREIGQKVFGKIGPENPDPLASFIRDELFNWQKSLAQYDQLAQTGEYPGLKEIKLGLDLTKKLLSVRDTYEFIRIFNSEKDNLLKTCSDLHTLNDFYTNQRPVWEKLKKSITGFAKNETVLSKHDQAGPDLKRLHEIIKDSAPYDILREVNPLISKVSEVNDKLLTERRQSALQEIELSLERVKRELTAAQADPDFSNKMLYSLQQIKVQVSEESGIPNISYLLEEFSRTVDEALDQIEEYKQKVKDPDKPKQVKITRTFKATSVAPKVYLENEQDVEAFIQAVRAKLLEELKENVRIRVK